ncbi:MAG: hypothetical protein J0G29_03135 [Alphaproteobacteria bacterium]|nr:hypothetical protein [Alphaproteobacteria bacterium]OJV46360.1 MAG: hypothetical protein BGO28_03295 [Alphaproteobacteria bacterium 43-37]
MSSKRGQNQTESQPENSAAQQVDSDTSTSASKNCLGTRKVSSFVWLYALTGFLVCTALAELWTARAALKLKISINEIQGQVTALEERHHSHTTTHENATENKLEQIHTEQASLSSRIEAIENRLKGLSKSSETAFQKMEELSEAVSKAEASVSEHQARHAAEIKNHHFNLATISTLIQALESDSPINLAEYDTLIPEELLAKLKDKQHLPQISKSALLQNLNNLASKLQPAVVVTPEDSFIKKFGNFITIRKISPAELDHQSLVATNALVGKIETAINHDDYSEALEHFNKLPKEAQDVLAPLHTPLENMHKKQILIRRLKTLLSSSSLHHTEPGLNKP